MYRTFESGFWDDPKVEPLSLEAKLLFAYLFTNRHSHVSGIYPLKRAVAALDLAMPEEAIGPAWICLEDDLLIRSDRDRNIVWVVNMLRHQGRGEKNERSAARQLETLHGSPLIGIYLTRYPEVRKYLRLDRVSIGYPDPENTLSETGGQNRRQSQEKEQEPEAGAGGAPPPALGRGGASNSVLMKFPCLAGKRNGPTTWELTESHREEWERAYPQMDILAEAEKARAWARANNLKTHDGMPAFLVSWFNRGQNSGRFARRGEAAPVRGRASLDREAYQALAEAQRQFPHDGVDLLDRVKGSMKSTMDPQEFTTWVLPLLPFLSEPDRLLAVAPNERFVNTLEESYSREIEDAATACGLSSIQIVTAAEALATTGGIKL